ncbi:MAG TPA: TetR/AcrR family transcriptional regulator [Candidatus Lumbricidophila sp.]|nr:TetR/AcrR family transcriptional regulator [Candidatus Lumbricidophila sp.]
MANQLDATPMTPEADGAGATGRSRSATQSRLLTAAMDLFTARGIRDTTVEDICEHAGFTRGAFYSNFQTKDELFFALYRRETDAVVSRFGESIDDVVQVAAPQRAPIEVAIGEIARLSIEFFARDAKWYLLCAEFEAQAMRQPDLRGPVHDLKARLYDGLAGPLERLLEAYGVRFTIDPLDATHMLAALYESALQRSLLDGDANPGAQSYVREVIPKVVAALLAPA